MAESPSNSSEMSTKTQESVVSFITSNFVQRECSKYVITNESKSDDCQCGRTYQWHKNRGIYSYKNTDGSKWKTETHTKEIKRNSFGEINFKGFDHRAPNSPYVRLDSRTELDQVWKLLIKYWHLEEPKFLISVTGGSKYFYVKPEVKRILKQAVCHAAISTGAWIITGGTGTGIMKMIGEAVHEYAMGHCFSHENIVTLGIVTWGIVSNRSALESERNGLFPATYDIKADQKDAKCAPLDHNHSHFILVDDGSINEYGREIKFRKALESYISKNVKIEPSQKQSDYVPIVTLVVAGGLHTLENVSQAVKQETPVVVIQGTGKAADFISLGYKLSEKGKCAFDKRMTDSAIKMFVGDGKKDENKIKKCLKYLKNTLKCRNLVTIFDLETANANKNINQAILSALIKAKKVDKSTQLKLALEWNCCDIARNEILTKENLKKIKLDDTMMTALLEDKADFVNLFIDSGVDLKEVLTNKKLQDLYKQDNNKCDTQLQFLKNLINHVKDRSTKDDEILLTDVNKLIEFLLKRQPFNFYSDKNKSKEEPPQGWHHLFSSYIVQLLQMCRKDGSISSQRTKEMFKETSDFENPEKELFIWAVLFNRREMAALFWQLGKDQLGAGLIASALLKSLSEQAEIKEELELSQSLASHAESFERRSTELLSQCYDKDKKMSHELLVRKLPSWGDLTLFRIADTYSMMDFMEHSSCQTKINSIWKGQMVPYTPELKILLCIFLPIFLPWIKFTSSDNPITKRWICSNKVVDQNKSAASEYKVTLTGKDQDSISFLSAWLYFCIAPVTKFFFNVLSYVVFLGIFSYFVLVDLRPVGEPQSPSKWEIIAWIWIATMIIEEIRQVLNRSEDSIKYKILNWFSNIWNKFDLLMYSMMILCIILRFCLITSNFSWARRMYSLTLILFYFRSMQFLLAAKNIGPKVIMIYRMLTDLMYFFYIMLVFVVSFGIAYHINMYPNSPQSWTILKNVLLMPYLQMYGELFLENVQGDEISGCTRNQSIWQEDPDLRCPEADGLSTLLLSVYMLLTNILLVNLVIAMFSYTFQSVQGKSRKVWRFHRLSLITEYQDCPTLVPPFIILDHLFQIIRWILCMTCQPRLKFNADNKKNEGFDYLNEFEKVSTNHYLSHTNLIERNELNMSMSRTVDRSVSDERVNNLSEESNDISQIKNMLLMLINERQQTQIWHEKDKDA